MARRRPRRRGARSACDETAGSSGSAEVSQAHDETLWRALVNRYRSASIVSCRDEGARQCRKAGLRSLAEQPGREFSSPVSKAGRGDGAVPGHQDPTEVCRCPCIDSQPLQPSTPSQSPRHFQTTPSHCIGRVASVGSLQFFYRRFSRSSPVALTLSSAKVA